MGLEVLFEHTGETIEIVRRLDSSKKINIVKVFVSLWRNSIRHIYKLLVNKYNEKISIM